jgi:NCS1 family nucleobase:cation symporter-1
MLVKLKVEHLALLIGVLCTLIACFAPLAQYQNFLLMIASVFAPLFGVVLVDHFVLRRRRVPQASVGLRGSALLAWLGGIVAYHLLANLYPEVGATLPALAIAGLLQWLLAAAFNRDRETARA